MRGSAQTNRWCLGAVLAAMIAAGCQAPPPTSRSSEDDAASAIRALPEHVVFTAGSLDITALEEPVALPVTVPSEPSPATVTSDDPDLVSIDPAGRAVAHAEGSTRLRARGGESSLDVRVSAPEAIRIDLETSRLEPGSSSAVTVRDSRGREIPPAAVRWETADPSALVVVGARVHALKKSGGFGLTAHVGRAKASVELKVGATGRPAVLPLQARLKVGEVVLFRVADAAAGVDAWVTEGNAVVSLGQGVVEGRRPGRSRVCARISSELVCSKVEVFP